MTFVSFIGDVARELFDSYGCPSIIRLLCPVSLPVHSQTTLYRCVNLHGVRADGQDPFIGSIEYFKEDGPGREPVSLEIFRTQVNNGSVSRLSAELFLGGSCKSLTVPILSAFPIRPVSESQIDLPMGAPLHLFDQRNSVELKEVKNANRNDLELGLPRLDSQADQSRPLLASAPKSYLSL